MVKFTLAERGFWREVAPVAGFGRQPHEESPEPVSVLALDRPDRQAPAIGKHEPVRCRRSGALGVRAQLCDPLLGDAVGGVGVHWVPPLARSGAGLEY